MKKYIPYMIILIVALMFALVINACAPTEPTPVVENQIKNVTHIASGNGYTLDYIEDTKHGYGCYIYDGYEAGSIFCFDLVK